MSYTKLKELVLKYLKNNNIMSLATVDGHAPWSVTVMYAHTNDFEIIFYSRPDRDHSKHIEINPKVSIVVNQQYATDHVIRGIQACGEAHMTHDQEKEKYYSIYKKKNPWAEKFEDHEIYVIKLSELWYIDQEYFGHTNRVKVI